MKKYLLYIFFYSLFFVNYANACDVRNISDLKECAEKGDVISQYNLGVYYKKEKDFVNAFYWFKRTSDQNLIEAKLNLPWFYENGLGVKQDRKRAFELTEELANQGYAIALNNLAKYYQVGIGTSKDLKKSIELYQKAIEVEELPIAYINLSFIYFYDLGDDLNRQKAINLLQSLSEKGNTLAMTNLGSFYKHINEKDKALFWMEKAAKYNDPLAQANLGFIYATELKNKEKALFWLNKSMNQEYSQAFFLMGTLYSQNGIFELDLQRAYQYYLKAAKMGNGYAQNNLGLLLVYGEQKNEKEGIAWLNKAANENNISVAMYELSQIYSKGTKEIPQDLEKAKYWLEKAKENGFSPK